MKKKKKAIKIGFILLFFIIFLSILWGIYTLVEYLRVKTAKIEVTLQDNLSVSFLEDKKISDFIVSINGKIINDEVINTKSIGEKTIQFEFINDDGIKVPYAFKIEVKDTTEPVIWLNNSYTIYKGNDVDIASSVLCGDDEDSKPNCYIEGEYDYNTLGEYPLTFKAEDRSGNVASKEFTLHVVEPKKNTSTNTKTTTLFQDVYNTHKNEHTKIGIDVSGWQGDIDFEKIKNAGVEFIIIKVGGTRGTNKEYYVDSKFIQNITAANQIGIDVGVYFYSYANTNALARQDAKWLLDQIKDYEVNLPIAFDWENWNDFNSYNLSFFGLTDMATTFLDTVKKEGYQGILYSSKNYLERLWLPTDYDVWLAHYTDQTNYQGAYTFWQLCSDGEIDGINGPVDIDIMYID